MPYRADRLRGRGPPSVSKNLPSLEELKERLGETYNGVQFFRAPSSYSSSPTGLFYSCDGAFTLLVGHCDQAGDMDELRDFPYLVLENENGERMR